MKKLIPEAQQNRFDEELFRLKRKEEGKNLPLSAKLWALQQERHALDQLIRQTTNLAVTEDVFFHQETNRLVLEKKKEIKESKLKEKETKKKENELKRQEAKEKLKNSKTIEKLKNEISKLEEKKPKAEEAIEEAKVEITETSLTSEKTD